MHTVTIEMIMKLSAGRVSPTKTKDYRLSILHKVFKV